MHLSALILSATIALASTAISPVQSAAAGGCPTGIHERREWRTLTLTQQTAYLKAVRGIIDNGQFATLSFYHRDNSNIAHNHPSFLPWHRMFLSTMERELQKLDPSVSIPYWQEDIDSQAPEKAPVWGPKAFGSNGRPGDNCVQDGIFANYFPVNPNRHCLKRSFNSNGVPGRMGTFLAPEAINRLISSARNFETIWHNLEYNQHAIGHNAIGGDMWYVPQSSNDPIFFSHHAYLDMLWDRWQKANPSLARTYGGQNADGTTARSTDVLPPFRQWTVKDAFDTLDLCYRYRPYSPSDVPKNPTPPVNSSSSSSSSSSTQVSSSASSSASPSSATPTPTATPTVTATPTESIIIVPSGGSSSITVNPTALPSDTKTPTGPSPTDGPTVTPTASEGDSSSKSGSSSSGQESYPTGDAGSGDNGSGYLPPDYNNRDDLTGIREPPALGDDWLNSNHYNATIQRECEKDIKTVYKKINSIPGYVSSAALINQPDLLSKLGDSVKQFTARYPGLGKIIIPISDIASDNMAEGVKSYLHSVAPKIFTPPADITTVLVDTVGTDNNYPVADNNQEDVDCDEYTTDESDCEEGYEPVQEECSEDEGEYTTESEGDYATESEAASYGESPVASLYY